VITDSLHLPLMPITGVRQHQLRLLVDATGFELPQRGFDPRPDRAGVRRYVQAPTMRAEDAATRYPTRTWIVA
jgi:hypothetical protein